MVRPLSGIALSGLVLAALSAAAGEARACSCLPPPPPKEALTAATAVFRGRAVEVVGPGSLSAKPVKVRLAVERSYKGRAGDPAGPTEITLYTAANTAACGYPFQPDGEYLIYADAKSDGTLAVSLCSRTRAVRDASEDLAILEQLAPDSAQQPGGPAQSPAQSPARPPAGDAGPETPAGAAAPGQETSSTEPRLPTATRRGGCAGCRVTGGDDAGGQLSSSALLLAVAALTLRRAR
jgi:hypothetical protein